MSGGRKILFLDIDGVLNSTKTCVAFGGYPLELHEMAAFDQVAIRLIQRLCDSAGVQIVLSSAWRISHPFKDVGAAFDLPIIDRTPSLATGFRGFEINAWLSENEFECYAIIDDNSDMLPDQMPFFVHTNQEEGMTWADFVKLCGLFGESAYAGAPRDLNWRTPSVQLAWDAK